MPSLSLEETEIVLAILSKVEQQKPISDTFSSINPYQGQHDLYDRVAEKLGLKPYDRKQSSDHDSILHLLAEYVNGLLIAGMIRQDDHRLANTTYCLTEEGKVLLQELQNQTQPSNELPDEVTSYWREAKETYLVRPRAAALLLGVAFEHFVEYVYERLPDPGERSRSLKPQIDYIAKKLGDRAKGKAPDSPEAKAKEAWACMAPIQRWARNGAVHEPNHPIPRGCVAVLVETFPELCQAVTTSLESYSPSASRMTSEASEA